MMAPAIRLGGTSANTPFNAAKAWVPLFSPVVVVVTLVSRSVEIGLGGDLAAQRGQGGFGLRRALAHAHALRAVHHHRHDIGQAAHGFP